MPPPFQESTQAELGAESPEDAVMEDVAKGEAEQPDEKRGELHRGAHIA